MPQYPNLQVDGSDMLVSCVFPVLGEKGVQVLQLRAGGGPWSSGRGERGVLGLS
jgi:hypothetical protein